MCGHRGDAHRVHGAVVLGWLALSRRDIGLIRRWLKDRVVNDATVWRGIGCGWANTTGTVAPDLFELSGRNIGAIVGSDGRPELLAASLVDGAKTVCVDDLGLVGDLSVDAKTIEGLRRRARSQSTRLGQKNLVLNPAWGSTD